MRYFILVLLSVVLMTVAQPTLAECGKSTCEKGTFCKKKSDCESNSKKELCERPKQVDSDSFKFLKSLAGSWKGTHFFKETGKKSTIKTRYRVTAGGSAIEETIFPGTPFEMVSMYTQQKDKVHMTHYCVMGTQPHLVEKESSANQIKLAFDKKVKMPSSKDGVMGNITITLRDPKHMVQQCEMIKKGKVVHTETFEYTRE